MDRGAYVLSTLIDLWSSLEHVEMAHCGFSSSGFFDLCLAFKYAQSLETLDLHGNRLQSATTQLVEILRQQVTIRRRLRLNLNSCDIPSKGNTFSHRLHSSSIIIYLLLHNIMSFFYEKFGFPC